MTITKEQALELADKYLLHNGNFVLRDNISVSRSAKGWQIVAKTTPVISGMQTEITTFPIDMETGEVGVSLSNTISITDVLKEINERKDIDELKKKQLKAKVGELEKESTKKPVDKHKMNELKKLFEKYAPILSGFKKIIDIITAILSWKP